jgi:hypothetical protein
MLVNPYPQRTLPPKVTFTEFSANPFSLRNAPPLHSKFSMTVAFSSRTSPSALNSPFIKNVPPIFAPSANNARPCLFKNWPSVHTRAPPIVADGNQNCPSDLNPQHRKTSRSTFSPSPTSPLVWPPSKSRIRRLARRRSIELVKELCDMRIGNETLVATRSSSPSMRVPSMKTPGGGTCEDAWGLINNQRAYLLVLLCHLSMPPRYLENHHLCCLS